MSIAIGGNSVSKMYVGSTEITKAYIGDTLVYGGQQPTPSGYYYIYRTSSNIIERRDIAQYPTVNFPAIAGNSYGGVFTDYGGKGTVATAILNGDPVTFVNDRVWDDGSGYAGELTAEGSTEMFTVADAITTGTTAYTPTVGAMYFIREIPDWILVRNQTTLYNKSTNLLTYVIVFSGIDSPTDYKSAILYFKEETQESYEAISISYARQLTVSSSVIKASTAFRTKGCPTDVGFLIYKTDLLNKLEEGKNYIMYFEVITFDDVAIHSSLKTKLTVNNLTRTGLSWSNIPFEPVTYDSQVEYIETSSDNCSLPIDVYNLSTRRFEIDAYIPPTSLDGWLVGSMLADGTKMYAFTPCDENGLSSYKIGSATSPTSLKLEGRYTFSNMANVSECVVTNGTDTITYTSGGTNATNYLPIYLLGLNEGGGGRKTIKGIKLYSAKFYTVASSGTTTLVKDLVPVRKDGRGYLYDKVDELQLYAPKGDPITVYGADVVESE